MLIVSTIKFEKCRKLRFMSIPSYTVVYPLFSGHVGEWSRGLVVYHLAFEPKVLGGTKEFSPAECGNCSWDDQGQEVDLGSWNYLETYLPTYLPTLGCLTLPSTTLHYFTLQYSTLQYITLNCSTYHIYIYTYISYIVCSHIISYHIIPYSQMDGL